MNDWTHEVRCSLFFLNWVVVCIFVYDTQTSRLCSWSALTRLHCWYTHPWPYMDSYFSMVHCFVCWHESGRRLIVIDLTNIWHSYVEWSLHYANFLKRMKIVKKMLSWAMQFLLLHHKQLITIIRKVVNTITLVMLLLTLTTTMVRRKPMPTPSTPLYEWV